MAALQRRWIDWNVKLRQTQLDGWDEEFVGRHAYVRGFPRTASLNLANAQQGGRPVLDADDPRSEKLQIGRAIDQALRPVPGLPPVESLGFQFNPSEFSETDEDLTVERLNTVASLHRAGTTPASSLFTINHGTAQPADRQAPGALLRSVGVRPAAPGRDGAPADVLRPGAPGRGRVRQPGLRRAAVVHPRPAVEAAHRPLPRGVVVADLRPAGAAVPGARHAGGAPARSGSAGAAPDGRDRAPAAG